MKWILILVITWPPGGHEIVTERFPNRASCVAAAEKIEYLRGLYAGQIFRWDCIEDES